MGMVRQAMLWDLPSQRPIFNNKIIERMQITSEQLQESSASSVFTIAPQLPSAPRRHPFLGIIDYVSSVISKIHGLMLVWLTPDGAKIARLFCDVEFAGAGLLGTFAPAGVLNAQS